MAVTPAGLPMSATVGRQQATPPLPPHHHNTPHIIHQSCYPQVFHPTTQPHQSRGCEEEERGGGTGKGNVMKQQEKIREKKMVINRNVKIKVQRLSLRMFKISSLVEYDKGEGNLKFN